MDIWIYAILIIVLVFVIWNTSVLYQLKKLSKEGISSLKDERYFELKYRLNYFIAAGTIIVFLFAYIGVDTKRGLEENVSKELENYKDKFVKVDSLSDELEQNLIAFNDSINKLIQKQLLITNEFSEEQQELDRIEQQYENLKKEIINNPIINVARARIDKSFLSQHDSIVTLYFENCVNLITGDKLKPYRNKPFVLIHLDNFSTFPIEVTKDYFTIQSYGAYNNVDPDNDYFEFSFIIFSY